MELENIDYGLKALDAKLDALLSLEKEESFDNSLELSDRNYDYDRKDFLQSCTFKNHSFNSSIRVASAINLIEIRDAQMAFLARETDSVLQELLL